MNRLELIEQIEDLLERLDVHDELVASGMREFMDRTTLGMNGLKNLKGEIEVMLSAYEVLSNGHRS